MMFRALVFTVAFCAGFAGSAQAADGYGLSMYGDLKYGPDFTHFDYANPDAPKGGSVRMAGIGTFDSLNPFVLKGLPPDGIGLTYDTLMAQSADEPFSEYGLIAKDVEVAKDNSWVRFNLRPEARWHDGKPITPEDVVFTFDTRRDQGHPRFAYYYGDVDHVEKTGPRQVTFYFKNKTNRELPLIIGQMEILPKHYWQGKKFESTLTPPVTSGPYKVASVDPGRSVTYTRVKDYWGKDLPVNKGRYNFDEIRYDYYRDATVALEAFKAGNYDFRQENVSKNWATAYDVPAVNDGMIKKVDIPNHIPTGMQGFFYNIRRPVFKDPRVRKALGYAFDFEWTNKNLFYGAYTRTESYFSNSELAARKLPTPEEIKLLKPYRDQVPPEVFNKVYQAPETDGSGNPRHNLRIAMKLLRDAGWQVQNGVLTNKETGKPFQFEILLVNPSFERIVLPFVRNLKRLGIKANVRTVDPTQYQNRIDNFDFDMTVYVIGESLSPGNEQRQYWGSKAADTPGSQNIIGIQNPVVDAMIDKVVHAQTRQELIYATRALDRVLLWNYYVIPHWHLAAFRLAYWNKFGRPENPPPYGLGFNSWWVDPAKAKAVQNYRGNR